MRGRVAASLVSTRACYAGVVERSVYVHPDARCQRIGKLLLDRVIEVSEAGGFWTIQASICPENRASAALHTAAGFRTIGARERIAAPSCGTPLKELVPSATRVGPRSAMQASITR